MHEPTPTATFIHLSDLHLGEDASDVGDVDRGRITPETLKRRGGLKMQSHDPYILAALPTAVRSAARFIQAPDDSFDLYLVTGDVSTAASSKQRFKFARDYLCGKVRISTTYSTGLEVAKDKLLCVPGNHDKMYEATPERYLTAFRHLPAPSPYKHVIHIKRSGQRFVFYAIDSNLYDDGNIALGKIYPETIAWLSEQFLNESSEKHDSRSIRVLILHHHPADLNPFRKWSVKAFFRHLAHGNLTKLEEGDRLLELCAGNVDLILHGHEHFPVVFYNEKSNCVIQSTGTASQFTGERPNNCFHTLSFFVNQMVIHQFDWNGARFRPTRRWIHLLGPDSPKAMLDIRPIRQDGW